MPYQQAFVLQKVQLFSTFFSIVMRWPWNASEDCFNLMHFLPRNVSLLVHIRAMEEDVLCGRWQLVPVTTAQTTARIIMVKEAKETEGFVTVEVFIMHPVAATPNWWQLWEILYVSPSYSSWAIQWHTQMMLVVLGNSLILVFAVEQMWSRASLIMRKKLTHPSSLI